VKFRWRHVIQIPDAHENVGSRKPSHFWMAYLVGLTTRHYNPERFEGPFRQQIAKGLKRHTDILNTGRSSVNSHLAILSQAIRRFQAVLFHKRFVRQNRAGRPVGDKSAAVQ
jgi:hypothetical protein